LYIESSAKTELSIDFMFLTLASRRKTAIHKDGSDATQGLRQACV